VIFGCSAIGLFEALQTSAPIERHSLHIADRPHLYPLARVESQYPRYAAVVADTNSARIFVFAAGEVVRASEIKNVKTRHTSEGGWSQPRYQRHIQNFHLHHAKEVVEALDRIVRDEAIDQVILAGDEVITPLLRDQMPKALAARIVDHVKLAAYAPLADVVAATREAMARVNERTDREKVDAAIGAYRAGGLGVVGAEETLDALVKGQVEELLLAASIGDVHPTRVPAIANDAALVSSPADTSSAGEAAETGPEIVRLADELVARARQTADRITFIEDRSLLAAYGGVAALLRFRI
jgi:peptide chain release factor subunit 1